MSRLHGWWYRIRTALRGRAEEAELDEEVAFHLEMESRKHLAAGLAPADARRAALTDFGNVARTKDDARDLRGTAIDELTQDVRYAWRSLRAKPAFLVVVMTALGLGIGANTAIFSVNELVALRPLPYRDPGRIVMLWESTQSDSRDNPSPGAFLDWQQRARSFSTIAAYMWMTFDLTGVEHPESIEGQQVTPSLFRVLELPPVLGRPLTDDDAKPGAARAVVISHALWQRRFAGDTAVLTHTMKLNGDIYAIVGVLPRAFRFPDRSIDVWAPLAFDAGAANDRHSRYLGVVARLGQGASRENAERELGDVISVPLRDSLMGDSRRVLQLFTIAAALVLLLTCANVANMFWARSISRHHEMAVRAALGAGARRLIRQSLAEASLFAVSGGALGWLVAWMAVRGLRFVVPSEIADGDQLVLNRFALAFALALTAGTALVVGVGPALRVARSDAAAAIKAGGRGVVGSLRMRFALVSAEVALAMVVLIGSALVLDSFVRVSAVDPGFRSERLLVMRVTPSPAKYFDARRRVVYLQTMLDRIAAQPGVAGVAISSFRPLSGVLATRRVDAEPGATTSMDLPEPVFRVVNAGYFRTLGISLSTGREFQPSDNENAARVAIVNAAMARRFWSARPAVGERIRIHGAREDEWLTVVGVAADIHEAALDQASVPELFVPFTQFRPYAYRPQDLMIRTTVDPLQLAAPVEREILAIDPDQPVGSVTTMQQIVQDQLQNRRLQVQLLAMFAILALVLASTGTYGVIAFDTARRTREIGLRIAIGATPGGVFRSVIGRTVPYVGAGLAIGVGASAALSPIIGSVLYGVSPTDGMTYVSASVLLVAIGLVAAAVPAARAMRADPLSALRAD